MASIEIYEEFVRAFAVASIHKILYIVGSLLVFIELVMCGD